MLCDAGVDGVKSGGSGLPGVVMLRPQVLNHPTNQGGSRVLGGQSLPRGWETWEHVFSLRRASYRSLENSVTVLQDLSYCIQHTSMQYKLYS